ncbi:MAG: hypothetical protein OK422_03050 [Thaumarchaeota archaeon]|nr:hypothetical protein [Nitrososphaerota archaeon]
MPAVNRFCVMATLQAARAFALGLSKEEAYSWGLNRAIFYAAAKRGFRGKPGVSGVPSRVGRGVSDEQANVYALGDEIAYRDNKVGKARFTIGGKIQSETDFDKQIITRFNGTFPSAWEDALDLMKKYDAQVLLSQARFYTDVYKPVRDTLAEKWNEFGTIKR